MPAKFFCIVCAKSCKSNQNAIYCDICQKWLHQKCSELSIKEFTELGKSNLPYFCIKCYETIFPYHNLNKAEFSEIHSNEGKSSLSNFLHMFDDNLCDFSNNYITPENFYKQYATSTNDDFFMLHINTRSLNKHFEKLEEFVTQLGKLPEIIAISETKLHSEFKMQLQGYTFIQNNSNTNAGGVGMFIKETLTFQSLNKYQLNTEGCEDLWITVNINNTKKVFGVLYRHPQTDFTKFNKSFELTLATLNREKAQYYIGGDVNINLLDYESKSSVKNYVDMLCSSGCLPLIKHPTRITPTSSTLIDHIYTNATTQNITSNVILNDFSVHFPVSVLIHNLKNKSTLTTSMIRDYKSFKPEDFIVDLSEELDGVNFTLDLPSSRDDFATFLQIFVNALNKHAPLRKKSRKEIKLGNKPWITKGILNSSKTKNKPYQISLTGKSEDVKLYKAYRNKLSHIKEMSKREYYSKLVNDSKHNMRTLWKTINDITKFKKRSTLQITELLDEAGIKVTDHIKMANLLNDYFSEIGQKMAAKIDKPSATNTNSTNPSIANRSKSFFFKPVTTTDILTYIQQLNVNKSAGPEDIPIKIIKMSASVIAPVLEHLFNKCLINGVFPDSLKIGKIVPIHKKGPKNECCNYRPITLLSPLSKIFEKYIYEQMYTYLEKFKLLTPNQFGFRQNCATSQAVRQLYDDFLENLDKKKITCSVFIDLSKAFDTVDQCSL